MNHTVALLMFVMFMLVSEQSYALRCGNKLVSKGDPKPKVIYLCGEPDYKELREVPYPEHCIGRHYDDVSPYYQRRYGYHNRRYRPNVICKYRIIDVWTYNFGPRKFMRELIFRRGVVKEINTLDYGY